MLFKNTGNQNKELLVVWHQHQLTILWNESEVLYMYNVV